jgi:hypothetical protein
MNGECWHCRSIEHDTGNCPGRYRGGAVDGTYEEFCARRKKHENDTAAIARAETARGGGMARSTGQTWPEAAEGAD